MKRFIIGVLLVQGLSWAQSNYGSIRGQVTDVTGSSVPNAAVEIKNLGTNGVVKLTTNQEGFYVAATLPPVDYEVKVSVSGFQTVTVSPVKVDTAQISTVNVVLKPGSVSETVTVTGEAPLLQTYTGTVQQTVDQRTINELPLNGRNTLELAMTLPGVSGSPGTEISEFTTNEPVPGRELAINGGRVGSTQFQADGANVTSIALARMSISFSPDTIQEFSVQQANFSAQYAQAGGAIIQQTTKSGSNEFHGTLYWFHRQRAFTANPFDTQRTAVTNFDNRPPLRRQQLGAVLTGPVDIPKVYKGRDKTFFFFSYEGERRDQALTYLVTVPLPAYKTGNFAEAPFRIHDPLTTRAAATGLGRQRDPFPGNAVPASRLASVVLLSERKHFFISSVRHLNLGCSRFQFGFKCLSQVLQLGGNDDSAVGLALMQGIIIAVVLLSRVEIPQRFNGGHNRLLELPGLRHFLQ